MALEVEGILHKKFDTQSKTETFQAREFVLKTDGQYPQFVKFQLTQDRCQLVDGFEEGQTVKVSFDLRGREWQGKYFTNLNAWKIESLSANTPPPAGDTFPSEEPPFNNTTDTEGFPPESDMPF